jgi:hypothetical protein
VILAKSIVVGLCSAVTATLVLLLGGIVALAIIPHPEDTAIAIDPISVAESSPPLWVLGAVVFFVAFYWEYRREKRRQSKRPQQG